MHFPALFVTAAVVAADAGKPLGTPTYSWKFQKQSTSLKVSLTQFSDATLPLLYVDASATGTYWCEVANAAGTVLSTPINVIVNTLPSVKSGPTLSSKSINPGTTVVITLEGIGDPEPSIEWLQNGQVCPLSSLSFCMLYLTRLNSTGSVLTLCTLPLEIHSVSTGFSRHGLQQIDDSECVQHP